MKKDLKTIKKTISYISYIPTNSKALCIGCFILSVLSFIGIGMLDIPRIEYSFDSWKDELIYTIYNLLSMIFFFSLVLGCFLGGHHIGKPKVLEMEN